MTIDYLTGSLAVGSDLTLPYIWVSPHLNAKMEQEALTNPRLSFETKRMADEITFLLRSLAAQG